MQYLSNFLPPADVKTQSYAYLFFVLQSYLLLSIFQIGPSGDPQPADYFLAANLVVLIGMYGLKFNHLPVSFLIVVLFGAYAFLINTIHYTFLPDYKFFIHSLIYLFNAATFMFFAAVARASPDQFFTKVYNVTALTILIQLGLAITTGIMGSRFEGTFNNPNQMSYWSLLSLCTLLAVKFDKKLTVLDFVLILVVGYIQATTLSKAGNIAYFFVIGSLLFSNMLTNTQRLIMVALSGVLVFFLVYQLDVFLAKVQSVEVLGHLSDRLETIGSQNDDSLEGRGYDRLYYFPEFLIFGAGEGGYSRFRQNGPSIEIHSGLATLIFCYGIIGAGLFCSFIFMIFKKLPLQFWLLLVAIMLYGLTHQNLRFSNFWIFLSCCYGVKCLIEQRKFNLSGTQKWFPQKSGHSEYNHGGTPENAPP